MAAVINLLQVVPPLEPQPVAALPVAKSALFVAINILAAPSYLWWCFACDDGGRWRCFSEVRDVEQMWYQMASFATFVLGIALLAFHMASSSTAMFPALAVWLVWLTKVKHVPFNP